jgi:hypothetical protein
MSRVLSGRCARDVILDRGEQFGPPDTHEIVESRLTKAMFDGVIGREPVPSAVLDRDSRGLAGRFESDFDLRRLAGLKRSSERLEHQTPSRFPDFDPAKHKRGIVFVRLKQATTDTRLEVQDAPSAN